MRLRLTLFLLSLMIVPPVWGQSINELQRQKKQTLERIANTNKLIQESNKNKALSTEKLSLIESKIESRTSLIENLGMQVNLYTQKIENKRLNIAKLQKELNKIKDEYARFLRKVQFTNRTNSVILYLLASEDLSQMYRRMRFYREYKAYQQEQYLRIIRSDSVLQAERQALERDKANVLEVQAEERHAREEMEAEKEQYNRELDELLAQEHELRRQVEADQRRIEELNRLLQSLMREEAQKGKEMKRDASYIKQGAGFAKNKGKLPWPIRNGVITRGYGQERSKVFKNVKTESRGVDFTAIRGSNVHCVFPGVVSKIAHIPGGNEVVIIRHGEFLTLYSNLEGVLVHVGQEVRAMDILGTAHSDQKTEQSILHFEVWQGFEAQDPKQWLLP